ncbi:MAG: GGDEF domain-containing protein [Desulfuromonadales bacterium]|nr:GGDEF domain-containing protein [Desulfuromonadales bacterium]
MNSQSETQLFHNIANILHSCARDDQAVIAAVNSLAMLHGHDAYDEFFYVLTRKRFGASLSSQYWKRITDHVDRLIRPEYRGQGFLPAILHFLQYEADVSTSPLLIESDYIENIRHSSITDGLTGLYNQSFFKASLQKQIHRAQRHPLTFFSIVLFDMDHFKEFNDTAGHLAGDHVLQRVADIIREGLRESDIAARYGGEEFALLLPQTSRAMARKVAQRIRIAIERELFAGQEQLSSENLTISGGIAEYPYDAESADTLIEFADLELYKSKTRRNSIYPNEDDRRRGIRLPVRSLVEYLSPDHGSFRPGLTFNVSEFGVLLGCDRQLPVNQSVMLRFSQPYWRSSRELNGIVRQFRMIDELCVHGLEFDQELGMTGP